MSKDRSMGDTSERLGMSKELLRKINQQMLRSTDRDEDQHFPSERGIEMVLQAISSMPELKATWSDPYGRQLQAGEDGNGGTT